MIGRVEEFLHARRLEQDDPVTVISAAIDRVVADREITIVEAVAELPERLADVETRVSS
jgi:hypothetical protein